MCFFLFVFVFVFWVFGLQDPSYHPALGAQSLNHWTAREVPSMCFLTLLSVDRNTSFHEKNVAGFSLSPIKLQFISIFFSGRNC